MAAAQTSDVFNCSPEQFYKIVTGYENYPDFLQEVKACKVLKTESGGGGSAQVGGLTSSAARGGSVGTFTDATVTRRLVEFSVSVVKSFKYSLWMTEVPYSRVSWELAGGDIFKTSKGFWKLEAEGKKCKATYQVEATFSLLVPGPLAKALVSVNLPNMISAYHKRVADLYGR